MTIHGGRSVLILVYSLLAISGFMPWSSGFVALIALPIELLFLIFLYSLRPSPLHRSPYPSAGALLGGSVPMFLFYWFIAAGVGGAMDNVDPGPDDHFLLSPFIRNTNSLVVMVLGYFIALVLDYRALRKHPDAWANLPQRLITKGLSIWILAYLGIVAVLVTGEAHHEWAIACLMMGRIAVEFALRPLDEEGTGVWAKEM